MKTLESEIKELGLVSDDLGIAVYNYPIEIILGDKLIYSGNIDDALTNENVLKHFGSNVLSVVGTDDCFVLAID